MVKSEPKPTMRIAILGGGIAGLAIANLCLRLSENIHLTIYEHNSWLGGKLRRLNLNGQTMDMGPSIFTIPQIWQSFLNYANTLSPKYPIADLSFVKLDGLGQFLSETYDLSLPPTTRDDLSFWQRYEQRHGSIEQLIVTLMQTPPRSAKAAAMALRLLAFYRGRLSVEGVLKQDSYLPQHLRDTITIHSLNSGLTPAKAFNLYASVPALLAKSGVFIPKGGMYELVKNLELGLRPFRSRLSILTDTKVRRVDLAESQIYTDSNDIAEDYDLIINALDHERFQLLTGISKSNDAKYSCSAAGFYMVLKENTKLNLKHPHTVLMPRNMNVFEKELESAQPLDSTMCFLNFYQAGSEIYPSNSRDVLAFLLTVPADGSKYSLEHPLVMREMKRAAHLLGWCDDLVNLCDHIEIFDPQYFAEFGAFGGSIYGRALAWHEQGPSQVVQHQDRLHSNLFHVGASVYPGGGVPAILAGVQITAARIAKKVTYAV